MSTHSQAAFTVVIDADIIDDAVATQVKKRIRRIVSQEAALAMEGVPELIRKCVDDQVAALRLPATDMQEVRDKLAQMKTMVDFVYHEKGSSR